MPVAISRKGITERSWQDLCCAGGHLDGHWAVRVSGNWRLTFAFEDEDAILVDYQDYR